MQSLSLALVSLHSVQQAAVCPQFELGLSVLEVGGRPQHESVSHLLFS